LLQAGKLFDEPFFVCSAQRFFLTFARANFSSCVPDCLVKESFGVKLRLKARSLYFGRGTVFMISFWLGF
jgi:hypothetical protein